MADKSPGGVEKLHSSLEDLVWNSKSLITRLFWLDDENDIQTKEAIGTIREITNLTKTFYCTYEKVNRKTRKKLYDLRSTWEGIFSRTRLYNLDIQVHRIDPTWPIIKPIITHDKKSNLNIDTRENKRRFNRAMKV